MERLDIFYKAFEEYKKATSVDVETKKFQKFYDGFSGKKYEDITVISSTCKIEEDWVNAIEKGIVFLEKAIREEKQFIRNDEEVLPIEKVRKTTVDGIRDLAKHSNYITHEPNKDADTAIMPDKMLMVQRESDYAVYENRVVYATLTYLKDFVSSRLMKIKEAINKFDAKVYIKKTINTGSRKIDVDFSLGEIRLNDDSTANKKSCYDIVERLDNVMSNIMALLKTPLMMEVSKVDLVTRPITKTNVLRMNINFRESLALFDFIAEYNTPGYEIITTEKSLSPLTNEMLGSFSQVVMLFSFLTYIYANNLSDELKAQFIKNEEKLKKEEEEKLLKRLKSLTLKGQSEGKTLAELMDDFEKGYRILEKKLYDAETSIKQLEEKHAQELINMKDECDTKIESIYEETEKEKETIKDECELKLRTQADENSVRVNEIHESYRNEISSLSKRFEKEKEQVVNEKNNEITSLRGTNASLSSDNSRLQEENEVASALVISLKKELGKEVSTDDYLGREDFDNLEKQKAIFDKFFDETWKAAKKKIRKTILVKEKDLKAKKKAEKENR